jgi:hypothetical protein
MHRTAPSFRLFSDATSLGLITSDFFLTYPKLLTSLQNQTFSEAGIFEKTLGKMTETLANSGSPTLFQGLAEIFHVLFRELKKESHENSGAKSVWYGQLKMINNFVIFMSNQNHYQFTPAEKAEFSRLLSLLLTSILESPEILTSESYKSLMNHLQDLALKMQQRGDFEHLLDDLHALLKPDNDNPTSEQSSARGINDILQMIIRGYHPVTKDGPTNKFLDTFSRAAKTGVSFP